MTKRYGFVVVCLTLALLIALGCSSESVAPEESVAPDMAPSRIENEGGETSPDDVETMLREGRAAWEERDIDTTIEKLEAALRAGANSPEAHFLLGNAYAKKEQFAEAEQQYEVALDLDPDHIDARSNLGVIYYRQGELQEAEKVFRAALEQTPKDAEIRYNLGGVLASSHRLEEAVEQFRKAQELDPSLPEVYLGLGSAYKQQGRRQEAITALQEYVRLSQDAEWKARAEQMLRELEE